jgi:NitT/TauT family transport system permease protein
MSNPPDSKPTDETTPAIPADTVVRRTATRHGNGGGIFALRRPIPRWVAILLGILCIATALGVWWFLTRGDYEDRIVQYQTLPSPAETFAKEERIRLWEDNDLMQNLYISLRRVVLGFALAAAVGIPLGVLCGCFPWVNSFLAPVNVFGRNVPIAALIPLTWALFGIDELQKVMFIFLAAVAFVMMDTASAVAEVSDRYIDTAYTLGASRWQLIRKVIVPLAMPRVFNSLRLLFGLAFGYIMLAELVSAGGASGVGSIINISQRRSHKETIYLIVLIIPAVALIVDRVLYFIQRSLFPYQYGGNGLLHHVWRGLMHGAESLKFLIFTPQPLDAGQRAALHARK